MTIRQCQLTFVQASSGLHWKGVIFVQRDNFIWAEICPRTEKKLHPEALGTVHRHPAYVDWDFIEFWNTESFCMSHIIWPMETIRRSIDKDVALSCAASNCDAASAVMLLQTRMHT